MDADDVRLRCLIVAKSKTFARGLADLLRASGTVVVGEAITQADVEEISRPSEFDLVVSSIQSMDLAAPVARRHAVPILVLPAEQAELRGALPPRVRDAPSGTVRDDVTVGAGEVPRGGLVLPPESQAALLELLRASRPSPAREDLLTDRERQVVEHLTKGLSNKQIARSLGIAEQTVKNYASGIMRKVGVSSRTELCRWAIERGLHLRSPTP